MPKRSRVSPIVLSAIAFGGGGKSHFGLTAPKPIELFAIDPNTKPVLKQMIRDGELTKEDVRCHWFQLPALAFTERDDVESEATESWERVVEEMKPLVKDRDAHDAKSVVLDAANQFYDMSVLAEFGKLDQIHPEQRRMQMGRCNMRYKSIIQGLHAAGYHVILLHHAKEQWADKVIRSGRNIEEVRTRLEGPFDMERSGYKDTNPLVSVEVHLAFDEKREGALAAKYGIKFKKNTHRPILTGTESWGRVKLPDETRLARASFPWVGMQSFPGTTREDWS